MSSKDTLRKSNYSPQYAPASKPASKTFLIIAITVAVVLVLGVFLFFNRGQFVGKAVEIKSYCGDGQVQTPNDDGIDEKCDGSDLGGYTCQNVGYFGGNLACDKGCGIDTSLCINEPQCKDDANCGVGGVCSSGLCVQKQPEPSCKDDADCNSGEICSSGQCVVQQIPPKDIVQQESTQDQVLCQQIIDAPAKDKDLVGGVLNALENPNKLDTVLDVFTALNTWLKS